MNFKSASNILLFGLIIIVFHYFFVTAAHGIILKLIQSSSKLTLLEYIFKYFPPGLISHTVDFSIFLTSLILLQLYRENLDKQLSIHRLEKDLKQAQLSSLQMQLQPHFLLNALNTISSFMGRNAQGQQVIAKLGTLLRSILRKQDQIFVPLQEEFDLIRNYLAIEQARFHDRLESKIDLPDELTTIKVPAFILQPVVENAIKHGLNKALKNVSIFISAYQNNAQLIIEIKDTGVGNQISGNANGVGVGLENLHKRLHNIYQNEYSLQINFPAQGGCLVNFTLPLDSKAYDPNVDN